MTEYLMACLFAFMESIMTFILAVGFLPSAKISQFTKRLMVGSLLYMFTETAIERFIPSEILVAFLLIFLVFVFLWGVFQKSPLDTLLLTVLIYTSIMLIQMLLIYVFSFLTFPDWPYAVPLIGNLTTLLILCILTLLHIPRPVFRFLKSKSLPVLSAIVNLFGIAIMLNVYIKLFEQQYYDLVALLVLPILTVIALNIILIREFLKQQEKEKELAAYHTYLPLLEELIDQVRTRQHKYDNEIQSIRMLPSVCNDYEALSQELQNYVSYIERHSSLTLLMKLNYKLLAAFLSKKLTDAKNSNKQIDLMISTPILTTAVPEYELIDMVGVLFDNMAESLRPEETGTLVLGSADGRIIVKSENPGPLLTPELRKLFFSKGYTTKPDSVGEHGYGLFILKESVDKYNGTLSLENKEKNGRQYIEAVMTV